jgi:hypothetical protein
MQIPVLIESVANNGFRATAGAPLPLSAEGATEEQAVLNLRAAMAMKLRNGTQFTTIDVPAGDNPWLAIAGIYDPNDPLIQEWEKEMAAYRDEVDADPNRRL